MTTKVLEALSPPDNTIEILIDSGIAGTINMTPCLYENEKIDDLYNICIMLSELDELEDEDDEIDEDIDMIFMILKD